ncbi:MAG TPA: hypothetical protein DHW71_15355 [Gammaproteobacteria bacterium]|nr:DUF2909 domain-containing protein [Pseudomonadota bacterium]HBF09522.1 hypothetical protein [Gammaproteobacteria bacterium]HCK94369.1 hypothetical protein [Gammaproteobacteria bacterium]|tara:strand:+ start:135 stop:434 length:300 start_codon:yes stop_codon:yes gene_type:complete
MKWIFFLLMIAIFFNLFKGLFHLLKEGGQSSTKVVRSLTIRVGLTVLFFAGLYVSDYFGLIEGHRLDQGVQRELPPSENTDESVGALPTTPPKYPSQPE